MFKSSTQRPWHSAIMVSICLGITGAPLLSASAQMITPSWYRGQNPIFRDELPREWENRRSDDRFKPVNNNNQSPRGYSLSSGATVFAIYEEAEKIYVTKDETLPLTITVNRQIRNNRGQVIIPSGSKIKGEIRPVRTRRGSRFFAQTLILPNGVETPINAESTIVTRTEVIERGKDTDNVWKGAVAGAAAATLISGVTGNRVIATEKILGGAGLGALAGYLLAGQRTAEVVSFDAQKDFDLILRSDLNL